MVYARGLHFIQTRNEPCGEQVNAFWKAATRIARQMVLWDIPGERRLAALIEVCASSPVCCFAWEQARPVAMAWLAPVSAGPSLAASLHILFPAFAHEKQKAAAKFFLDDSRSFAYPFKSLLALAPIHYDVTRRFLVSLGFRHLATLPEACHMADLNLTTDGLIFIRKRNA